MMAKKHEFHTEYSKLPATQQRAKELGIVHYFTGKKCTKGHVSFRYASSGNCAQCITEVKGKTEINFRGRSSKRTPENQALAMIAIESGFTQYEPIEPCVHGHKLRYTSSNNCVECSYGKKQDRSEYLRWLRIKKEYGISKDDFLSMLNKQSHECSICQKLLTDKNTHIDHCHKTGSVRSLLCNKCNQAIGLFDEDQDRIFAAVKYLRRFKP